MSAFGHATVPVAFSSLYRQNSDNANRQAEHAKAPPRCAVGALQSFLKQGLSACCPADGRARLHAGRPRNAGVRCSRQ